MSKSKQISYVLDEESNFAEGEVENHQRRTLLAFAAGAFVAAQAPWLWIETEQPIVTVNSAVVEAETIGWEEVVNTVIGNHNRWIATGRGEEPNYAEGSSEWIMERVIRHNLHGGILV